MKQSSSQDYFHPRRSGHRVSASQWGDGSIKLQAADASGGQLHPQPLARVRVACFQCFLRACCCLLLGFSHTRVTGHWQEPARHQVVCSPECGDFTPLNKPRSRCQWGLGVGLLHLILGWMVLRHPIHSSKCAGGPHLYAHDCDHSSPLYSPQPFPPAPCGTTPQINYEHESGSGFAFGENPDEAIGTEIGP